MTSIAFYIFVQLADLMGDQGESLKGIIWEETIGAEMLAGAFCFAYSGVPQGELQISPDRRPT